MSPNTARPEAAPSYTFLALPSKRRNPPPYYITRPAPTISILKVVDFVSERQLQSQIRFNLLFKLAPDSPTRGVLSELIQTNGNLFCKSTAPSSETYATAFVKQLGIHHADGATDRVSTGTSTINGTAEQMTH